MVEYRPAAAARMARERPPHAGCRPVRRAPAAASPPTAGTVIIETSAVVEVLRARRSGRPPPAWFKSALEAGRIAVPRTVEVELKRLRKSSRRGGGARSDLSWLARLGGRELQWVYDLYRAEPVDGKVAAEIARMHADAARDPGGAAARAWLRSKRMRAGEGARGGGGPPAGPRAGRALAALYRAAENDRAIMAQAVAIAARGGGAVPPCTLVSRDGDFTAFAGRLGEISGGTVRTVHYSRM